MALSTALVCSLNKCPLLKLRSIIIKSRRFSVFAHRYPVITHAMSSQTDNNNMTITNLLVLMLTISKSSDI